MIASFIKNLATGIDGETYDPARVLWIVVCIGFVALAAFSVLHGNPFNPQDYGVGGGAILGGGGAGVGLKAKTEPQA